MVDKNDDTIGNAYMSSPQDFIFSILEWFTNKIMAGKAFWGCSAPIHRFFEFRQVHLNSYSEQILRGFCTSGAHLIRPQRSKCSLLGCCCLYFRSSPFCSNSNSNTMMSDNNSDDLDPTSKWCARYNILRLILSGRSISLSREEVLPTLRSTWNIDMRSKRHTSASKRPRTTKDEEIM